MEKKEFELLMSKVNEGIREAVTTEVKAAIDGVVKTDELTAKLDAMKVDTKAIDELTTAVETQGIEMKKLFDRKEEKKTMRQILEEHKDLFKAVSEGKSKYGKFQLNEKVLRSDITDSTIAMRLPGVGELPTQMNVIAPLFRQGTVGPNSGGVVRYIDQSAATRGADWTAEAGTKPTSDIDWQEFTLPVEKIADTIPVSMEALADIDFMESQLNQLLQVNLALKEDASLWSGDGVTPNVKGIYTYADTYTAPEASITDANIYDLIVKVQENIGAATKFMPGIALMNLADINLMRLKKDSTNNYILPPFASQDGSNVAGIRIIASNSVTANTMLVGDFNYATLYRLGGLSIDFGWIDQQFIENMVTLRAERREALLVRSVDVGAFNKVTDIEAALTLLATVPTP